MIVSGFLYGPDATLNDLTVLSNALRWAYRGGLEVLPAPELGGLTLVVAGLAGLAGCAWRRRRSAGRA